MAGIKTGEEFAAWQLADAFKSEVFALLKGSRETIRDRRFGTPDLCAKPKAGFRTASNRYAEQIERERRVRLKLKKS